MDEKLKRRIVFIFFFTTALLATVYYQYVYEKINASWAGINIYIWALGLSPFITLLMNYAMVHIATKMGNRYEFDHKRFVPGPYLYGFMALACVLSIYVGTTYTEPDREWSSSHAEVAHNDRYQHSAFSQWYYQIPQYHIENVIGTILDLSTSGSGTSSDSEGEGVLIMVVSLLLILIALIAAAAVFPHFWVISSIAVLLMMFQFLYRELKYN